MRVIIPAGLSAEFDWSPALELVSHCRDCYTLHTTSTTNTIYTIINYHTHYIY